MAKTAARSRVKKSRRPTTRRVIRSKTTRRVLRSKKSTGKPSKPKVADPLIGLMKGAERREVGRVTVDVAPAGAGRVKRMVYPPGFRWSKDMKPAVGTDYCMHAHVGFLARGEIHIEYPDGCIVECRAPQVVAIEPGHDGWVVGNEPVVLIEFDFEKDTIDRLGMPGGHRH
jgi:hypothetical protein